MNNNLEDMHVKTEQQAPEVEVTDTSNLSTQRLADHDDRSKLSLPHASNNHTEGIQ